MSEQAKITEEELHAYIDGELSPVRAADITALIQYDRDLAQKIAAFRADKVRLAEVYGPLIERPLPAAWLQTIERAELRKAVWLSRPTLWAMAASIVVMIVGIGTYAMFNRADDDAVISAALTARHEAVATLADSTTTTTVELANRTVEEALGPTVKAPDLSKLGYTLAAAHTRSDNKAVTIDYRDERNHIFTVYLSHSPGTERFDMLKRGTARICIWQDEDLSAVMVGEMSAGEMLRVASLAYAGLNAT